MSRALILADLADHIPARPNQADQLPAKLEIVDIDFKTDREIDGWASLAALEVVHGPLPMGPRVRRGGSSTHAYHQYNDRLRNFVGHLW